MQSLFEYSISLGVKPDVVFSIFTSISIFIAGFLLNRFNDWRIRKHKLYTVREFILTYLSGLIPAIEKQIEFLNTFSTSLKNPLIKDFVFQDSSVNASYIKSLSQIDVFESLVFGFFSKKKKRISFFVVMLDALNYYERANPILIKQFEYFFNHHSQYMEDWNKAVDTILRNIDQWKSDVLKNGGTASSDVFIQKLDLLIYEWQTKGSIADLNGTVQIFLDPIKQLSVSYAHDSRAMKLIPSILSAKLANDNRNKILKIFSQYFEEVGTDWAKWKNNLLAVILHYK